MKIEIPYRVIVSSDDLCKYLGVNEYCVSEGIIDGDDTMTVEITKSNLRILDELKDLVE